MSAHQYRITLEYLGGRHAGPELHAPLRFEVGNHDDLFAIIDKVRHADMLDAETSAALALGMKLFSEVMLQHKQDPMFAPMLAAYLDYITVFKQRLNEARPQSADSNTE
jgi:hypothetical protein